ncbi:MAG: prevent-host-death protein [Actinobacteria bacterium]|nr:prevent-host-death protein [Actinomycetota bacterium]
MKTLNVREARKSMTNIDKLLEKEGDITITRRGEPIARLSPMGRRKGIPSHRVLRESIARQEVQSETLVRKDRDGRG